MYGLFNLNVLKGRAKKMILVVTLLKFFFKYIVSPVSSLQAVASNLLYRHERNQSSHLTHPNGLRTSVR